MSLRDDLIAARALIDTPEKWGGRGKWDHPCALEALAMATHRCDLHASREYDWAALPGYAALLAVLPPEYHAYIGGYNDARTTTHADIMALFDRAIATAGAAP